MKGNGWSDKPYGIRNNFDFNFYTLYLLVASYLYLYIRETIENLFVDQDRGDNPPAGADNHNLQLVLFNHERLLNEEDFEGGAPVVIENSHTNNDVLFGDLDNGNNEESLAMLVGGQGNIRAVEVTPDFIVDFARLNIDNPVNSLLPNLHRDEFDEQMLRTLVEGENVNGEGRPRAVTLASVFENNAEGALAFIVHVLNTIEEEKEGDQEDVITTEAEDPAVVVDNHPPLLLTNGEETTFSKAIGLLAPLNQNDCGDS